jgi:hypothetical protein
MAAHPRRKLDLLLRDEPSGKPAVSTPNAAEVLGLLGGFLARAPDHRVVGWLQVLCFVLPLARFLQQLLGCVARDLGILQVLVFCFGLKRGRSLVDRIVSGLFHAATPPCAIVRRSLVDGPCVAGQEQFLEVAGTLLFRRGAQL